MVRTRENLSIRGSNDVPESSTQGGARKRPTVSARRRDQHEANVVEDDIVENEVLTTLHGVDRAMACVELNQSRGAQVRLSWLRELYDSCCENELWEFAARAYLLHLVGCTIFANKSATYVRTHYLELFRDLSTCRRYAWGVAALVYLYEQLGDVSFANTKQLVAYRPFLQVTPFILHFVQYFTCFFFYITIVK